MRRKEVLYVSGTDGLILCKRGIIMTYIPKTDSSLMSMTKKQLIEELRVAEHNFFTMEDALNNSATAGMDLYEELQKAKQLIKSMFNDIDSSGVICECCVHNNAKKNKPFTCQAGIACVMQYKYRFEDSVKELLKNDKNLV